MKRPLLWALATLIIAIGLSRTQVSGLALLTVPALLLPAPLVFKRIRAGDVILVTGIYMMGVFTGFRVFGAADPLEPFFDRTSEISGVTATAPEIKDGRTRLVLKTDGSDGLPRVKIQVQLTGAYQEIWAGDRVHLTGVLRRPEGARNPGGFDQALYLKAEGISGLFYGFGEGAAAVTQPASGLSYTPARMAQQLARLSDAHFTQAQSSLIKGVLLGDKTMADDLRTAFQAAGVSHILAVSGLHVSYIYAALSVCTKRLRIKRRFIPWVLLPCLIFYVCLTGARPSVIRASLMLAVLAFGEGLQENYDSLSALCLAAIVILIRSPAQLYTAGFQLSFLAVLGIILFNKPLCTQWERRFFPPGSILKALSVTLSATLITLPVMLFHFHSASAAGLLSNLVIVPLVGVLMGTAVLALIVLAFIPGAAVLTLPVAFLADLILELTAKLSGLGCFSIKGGALSFAALGLLFVAVFWLAGYFNLKKRPVRLALAAFLGVCVLTLGVRPFLKQSLRVTFLDVGQGDSALVETPSGGAYLIDGGGYEDFGVKRAVKRRPISEQVLLPALYAKNIRALDGVFISHNHADHSQGIEELLKSFPVKQVFISEKHNAPEALKAAGIPVKMLGRGDVLETADGLKIEVLWPDKKREPLPDDAQNDASLVIRLTYGGRSFLFTGDAGFETEANILDHLEQTDVLKVGHHGSKYSSGEVFLNRLSPSVAAISVGRYNTFGHPTPEALERLEAAGAKCLRTDCQGALEVTTDGRRLAVKTWLPP